MYFHSFKRNESFVDLSLYFTITTGLDAVELLASNDLKNPDDGGSRRGAQMDL